MKNVIVEINEYYPVVDLELGKDETKYSIQVLEELYERYNKAKKEFYDVQLILIDICRENKLGVTK